MYTKKPLLFEFQRFKGEILFLVCKNLKSTEVSCSAGWKRVCGGPRGWLSDFWREGDGLLTNQRIVNILPGPMTEQNAAACRLCTNQSGTS
jgi:hypothetical protein